MDGCFQNADEVAVLVLANSSLGEFCSISRAGPVQLDMGNALPSPTFPAVLLQRNELLIFTSEEAVFYPVS